MQKQNECAIFVFSRVGCNFDPLLLYQPQLIYSQTILGNLFVRSYRTLFKHKQQLCIVLAKRIHNQTQYLFLKLLDSPQQQLTHHSLQDIQDSINTIRTLKMIAPNATFDYQVLFAFLQQKHSVQINNYQFETLFNQPVTYPVLLPISSAQEKGSMEGGSGGRKGSMEGGRGSGEGEAECVDMMDGYQLQRIKVFVWSYLDTFGQKYQDNLYHEFQKNYQQHLDIQRIIRTVNWIVYCQTVDSPYNQLESSNWTCFEAHSKEKCRMDRKEIMLTGSGRILYIPLLFICQKLQNYSLQCDHQLNELMKESKKHYTHAAIKAYLLTDQVDDHNIIYRTQRALLRQHPPPEKQ